MADIQDVPLSSTLNRSRVIALLLEWSGVLLVVLAAVWAGMRVWQIGQTEPFSPVNLAGASALLGGSLALGVLLWSLGDVVRRVAAIQRALEERRSASVEAGSRVPASYGNPSGGAPGDPPLSSMVSLLREVRDITLLSEEERARRLDTQGRAQAADLERRVPVLLREHRWREARELVQEARERFPSCAPLDTLAEQIEAARAQVEAHDITQAERQVHDLSALGAWERAADVVRDLLERHPDSDRANALATSVRLRFEKSQAEQRERLMAQAQEATRQRDWQEALQLANELIDRFPNSPQADVLRNQLPRLRQRAALAGPRV